MLGFRWFQLVSEWFFLSRTLTTHKAAGEGGRGPYFIPLYHFHSLTNIQIFICNFSREMTITYFESWIYQTATRWDLPPYRITIWLIDDVMLIFVCLLVDLILGFLTAIWHEKPVDSNLHRLSSLYYRWTD